MSTITHYAWCAARRPSSNCGEWPEIAELFVQGSPVASAANSESESVSARRVGSTPAAAAARVRQHLPALGERRADDALEAARIGQRDARRAKDAQMKDGRVDLRR